MRTQPLLDASRLLLFALALALALPPAPAAAQAVTVEEATGRVGFRYTFELPAARGRFQPALALRHNAPAIPTAPNLGCVNSNVQYGAGWLFELPSVSYDGAALWLNLPFKAKMLRRTDRDGSTWAAEVESGYLAFTYPAGADDTAVARDAAGNKLTFRTPNYADHSKPFRLQTVEDPDGNVTSYGWENDGVEGRLVGIAYNSYKPAGSDRTNTAAVGAGANYSTLVSLAWRSIPGTALKLLDSIEASVVVTPGSIDPGTGLMVPGAPVRVRRYQLSYDDWSLPNDIGLLSITQTGTAGGTEQLVTSFERATGNGCLGAVVSPLGVRQVVSYVTSYSLGDAAVASYPVVKSITTTGPLMASNTVTYWYASPQRPAGPLDPDYRGFRESWSQDAVTKLVRHFTWNVASKPFVGWPLAVETGTQRAAGTATSPPLLDVFRTIRYTHAARSIGSGACTASTIEVPSSDYPVIPVSTSEEDLRTVDGVTLGSKATTPCALVDRWGNATQVVFDPDTARAGDELTIQSTYLSTTDPSKTCKDCLKTRATYAGQSLLELTELGYGATSQLTSVKRQSKAGETSATYPEVVSFSYHGNGNLASKTEGGATYVYTYDDWFQARVAKVEASDVVDLSKCLVTETAFDGVGRPVRVIGPYYETSLPLPASLKPERHLGYDSLGRLTFVARKPLAGTTVTEGLLAFRYQAYRQDPVLGFIPTAVTAYQFAVPKSFPLGSPPETEDVRQVATYLDGLGRTVQARERLGGATGDPAAAILQHLSQYRVTGALVLDGAGRVVAALADYYSPNAAYKDPLAASYAAGGGEVLKGPVQATWSSYDAQGRQTCSTVRAVTATLAASAPAPGACTSSFAEDASYSRATRTIYRGAVDPADGRYVLGVKSVEPRFTVSGGLAVGPESFVDAAGLVRRTTDAEGNGLRYLYDALGRATATVREAPGSNRVSVTSSVTLDMMGRVVNRTDPNFGSRTFTYESLSPGLLKAVRFSKTGEEVRYGYDMGRMKSVQFCAAGGACTSDANLSWDLPLSNGTPYANTAGRLGSTANPRTTIAFSYDDSGAMVRRDQWVGNGLGFSFTSTRRADGQVTQSDFIPAAGLGLQSLTTSTSFDSAARPVQVRAGTSTLWSATAGTDGTGAYTAFGALGTVQVDDGQVQQTWTRGVSSGLLTGQSVTIPGAANPVVYNVSGMTYRGLQLQGFTDTVNQTTQQYWYSNAGRLVASRARDSLTSVQKQLTCVGFATDDKFGPGPSFGNIEVVKEGSGALETKDYAYSGSNVDPGPAGPDAPTTVGTTSLTYDAFGRVATRAGGAEAFAYDLAGRLVSVTRAAGGSETLAYDPFGRPASRTVNGQTTWYLGNLATVTGAGATLQADVHVAVNGTRVASVRVGASPRTQYLHRDRLTSVVATTLAGGVRGASYRYTAHGALEAASGDAGDAASELGYAGALRLSGGLLLMGARVYDPGMRVFLQTDPLSPNDYTYAAGDPINKWDPTGMEPREAPAGPRKACRGQEGCVVTYFNRPEGSFGIEQGPEAISTIDREYGPNSVVVTTPLLDGTQGNIMISGGTVSFPGASPAGFGAGDLSRSFGGGRGGEGGGGFAGGRGARGGALHRALMDFDYITIGIGYMVGYGGGVHVTLDRNGHLTIGLAGGVGAGFKSFGVSVGQYQNKYGQRVSGAHLRTLNTGACINASVAAGAGYQINWPWSSEWVSLESQFALPGGGVTVGYSWEFTQIDWLSWSP